MSRDNTPGRQNSATRKGDSPIRARTREGMRVAKAKGKLKGKKPKLTPATEGHLVAQLRSGDYSINELARRYGVGVATAYRAAERAKKKGSAGAVTIARPRAAD